MNKSLFTKAIFLAVIILMVISCGKSLKIRLDGNSICTIYNPTPLMLAVVNQDYYNVKNIINDGTDVNESRNYKIESELGTGSVSREGKITAFNIAYETGNSSIMELLVNNGSKASLKGLRW
ncbi:MAG: hypothetical protein JXB50_05360 [Spirochaetes bacterium]|nr:hypothetical protein [Spirochaetota bacterium]